MSFNKFTSSIAAGLCVALLAACASQPATSDAPGATAPAPVQTAPATPTPAAQNEADTAATLEKKFQDAAKGYKVVQRDGQTLYCKREKVIGTTIPTMQCLTEAQLRNQVENMEELRGRMRSGAKCTLGPGGCSGGG
ncbi:MAG TPA: hypothetical protein VFU13_12500 [Steroidobacteraceae bacterium]|nr:hypothetical protein [Steroidobacteraceae bacterium]